MARVLVCLLGLLTVCEFGELAVSQEVTLASVRSSALLCDSLADGPSDCRTKSVPCVDCCFPASCCCDDYTPHPFPRSCFPVYPPGYQCVPAGDAASCPNACANKEKRSWWFLPTCHALRECVWLDP